ncbi:uncharacterized protein LOC143021593 [Oratosquilla oratoria]|uniref:uncharacterized protein LOC143021593 n=1 Tax=Oratosquilla oratoria TaxID=337810 RepID=UPI003F76E7FA
MTSGFNVHVASQKRRKFVLDARPGVVGGLTGGSTLPALERAQDQPKTVPPRRHIPSSFPVVLPPPFAPEGLRDCLWHSGRDPALPHQLSEPEAKLLTTEASTRQDLASTISTVTAMAMMRNWLTTLATSFEDFPREELRDTLAALSTVAEGTANMASSALPQQRGPSPRLVWQLVSLQRGRPRR